MPNLILVFNLPAEETEAKHAQRGAEYHAALYDFSEDVLRRMGKNREFKSDEARELFEQIRDRFQEIISDRDIDLFE